MRFRLEEAGGHFLALPIHQTRDVALAADVHAHQEGVDMTHLLAKGW